MEFKYYEWFYFLDEGSEVDPSAVDVYFKTYFEESLSVNISKRYDMGEENGIYYHDVSSIDAVKEFHQKKHSGKPMYIVKHFRNTVVLESYESQFIIGTDIFNFDENKKQLSSILLGRDKSLSEYRELFYDGDKEIKEKIVFKTNYNWEVHEEDITG
ncbi:hypothetical protein R5N98_07095 [Tenacibaculum maritimum]|uniref:hypothetical protein n=1 Tax=Tenacibaculum maritimum TaxID=107401 RepID=UPI0012E45873|nr:hypothetical protein [Tenacibaculum maritimum]MCD9582982.1 hypothetical protein [Tenacibaculum maritimum]MCD9612185.1 hypothetical protein [Tenacibaculum maritimum]MCD9637215.1 hypothetical protein [Tenacibaculum maritimum]CAA0158193.1 hypothetical protein NACSLCCMFF_120006 [Tenacibaculum maritimum]CAA0173525.1 hypothetical protein UCDSB2_150019 [Tenacibaculum maritimum]